MQNLRRSGGVVYLGVQAGVHLPARVLNAALPGGECTALYCDVLHCAALLYTVLCCSTLDLI